MLRLAVRDIDQSRIRGLAVVADRRSKGHVHACVEINRCVGCTRQFFTKSFLGDDATVLAESRRERPTRPRRRAGVASTACRVTDDAATAATDGASRRPKTHQRRRCDAGSPPTAPRHHRAHDTTILKLSPVARGPRPRKETAAERLPGTPCAARGPS